MSENQKLAFWWAVGAFAWIAVGAWNFWQHQLLLGILAVCVGWIWGSVNIFEHGFYDGLDAGFAEDEEMLEDISGICQKTAEILEKTEKGMCVKGQIELPYVACPNCNNTKYHMVGERFVCTVCGDVLPEDGDGN